MIDECHIDYRQAVADAAGSGLALEDALAEELPHLWFRAYTSATPHAVNVHRIDVDGYEYLFDFSTDLVNRGELHRHLAAEDRVVAVHGRSRKVERKRQDGVMQSQPLGPSAFVTAVAKGKYDRGHFVAHAVGGHLHINIFPQTAGVNRGWSAVGKVYRAMERYCSKNPGTYFFSRPLYAGSSAHPHAIEFGVLRREGTLWVNRFPNCASEEEYAELERLFRAALQNRECR